MPIIKTNILGSDIDINYNVSDHKKLVDLIESFKRRLEEFNPNGRISNYKLIFMAALKAEDQILELKKLNEEIQKDIAELNNQKIVNEKLNNEIILLKDKIKELNIKNISEIKNNNLIEEEINALNKINTLIKNKIKDSFK